MNRCKLKLHVMIALQKSKWNEFQSDQSDMLHVIIKSNLIKYKWLSICRLSWRYNVQCFITMQQTYFRYVSSTLHVTLHTADITLCAKQKQFHLYWGQRTHVLIRFYFEIEALEVIKPQLNSAHFRKKLYR